MIQVVIEAKVSKYIEACRQTKGCRSRIAVQRLRGPCDPKVRTAVERTAQLEGGRLYRLLAVSVSTSTERRARSKESR